MSAPATPPGEPSPDGVTELLVRWTGGDSGALDLLMPAVYAELKKTASSLMRRERGGHTLQPTALVHEAWMRMVRQDRVSFEHRKQFFGLAAQVMRRILVDHARASKAGKRGGGSAKAPLDAVTIATEDRAFDLLALDHALTELSRIDPRQAQVIELRYFAGLTIDELAETLGVSAGTIGRAQRAAEAWLGFTMSKVP
ncbi:MAG: sigma-70 family RNA polymerase sigma factor [Vicinamibacterales bacterium]